MQKNRLSVKNHDPSLNSGDIAYPASRLVFSKFCQNNNFAAGGVCIKN